MPHFACLRVRMSKFVKDAVCTDFRKCCWKAENCALKRLSMLTCLDGHSAAGLLVESDALADEVSHGEGCHMEQSHRD